MEGKYTIDEIKIRESNEPPNTKEKYHADIIWTNAFSLTMIHMFVPYGIYFAFTSAKLYTTIFAVILYPITMMGMTAGVHRLWAHRTYKAVLPLRIMLMILHTMTIQGPIYWWVRDHRLHHKYSETDADPHNTKRGLFFAHIGWLMCKKHPDVINKGKGIYIDDVRNDPVVAFQLKYYNYLVVLLSIIMLVVIPMYLWNETFENAYILTFFVRYVLTLNATFLVNSVAHRYGQKPYDINIYPAENKTVSVLTLGEGSHNYHHTFPWDYKGSELGNNRFNLTTRFIHMFASIGWAYDLKTVSMDNLKKRVTRTGDVTQDLWGWGDKDQTRKEREVAILTNTRNEKQEEVIDSMQKYSN